MSPMNCSCRPGRAKRDPGPILRSLSKRHGVWVPAFAGTTLPPNLGRQFHDHPQLCPLLVLGEHIALLGRSKSTLRRQAELVERHIFRRLVDAALELVLALQRATLRSDEAEHDNLSLGHEAQRLEAAGAGAVELH